MKTNFAVAFVGAALIALPAMAQTTAPATTPPATNQEQPRAQQQQREMQQQPGTMQREPGTAQRQQPMTQQQVGAGAMFEMKPGNWRATRLTGLAVYNPQNERIGDINELIIDREGRVEAVVIGVGGFLGIGEHLAAVPFDQVQWVEQRRDPAVGTTAPGTGATAPSAGADRPATTGTTAADRPATTGTTADRPATSGTTADRPATTGTTADRPATTGTTADRPATGMATGTGDAYRGYPEHAVVNMTREQLEALPQVRYAR